MNTMAMKIDVKERDKGAGGVTITSKSADMAIAKAQWTGKYSAAYLVFTCHREGIKCVSH